MTTQQISDQDTRGAALRAGGESNGPSRKLRVDEAARHVGLAVSTLNKMRMSGSGPRYIQLTRRRVAYDLLDLEAWVAERKRNHTSEQF